MERKEVNLTDEFDARVWAKEFMRIYSDAKMQGNYLWIDEELMLSWFANALMAGHDYAKWALLFLSAEKMKGIEEIIKKSCFLKQEEEYFHWRIAGTPNSLSQALITHLTKGE